MNKKTTCKELKKKIEKLKEKIKKYKKEMKILHKWEESNSGGGLCRICGTYARKWYCPNSPDHLCHYKGESEDCIYCGEPEERL